MKNQNINSSKDNSKSLLPNLFANSIVLLARKIVLTKYISNLWGNWGTKKFSYNTGNKDDSVVKNKDNIIENRERIWEIITILIISYDNFSNYIFIYKLAYVKLKIKKIDIELLYFDYNIWPFTSIWKLLWPILEVIAAI